MHEPRPATQGNDFGGVTICITPKQQLLQSSAAVYSSASGLIHVVTPRSCTVPSLSRGWMLHRTSATGAVTHVRDEAHLAIRAASVPSRDAPVRGLPSRAAHHLPNVADIPISSGPNTDFQIG